MLIALGGLPGTGKSSIGRRLAKHLAAAYLRIDTIEQALRSCETRAADIGTEGYLVAYRIAEENLKLGNVVVADSVNPLELTRVAWLEIADNAGVQAVEIEIVCSDLNEHRQRVATRSSDIPDLIPPTWEAVQSREYEPWNRPHILIDTSGRSIDACVAELLSMLPHEEA